MSVIEAEAQPKPSEMISPLDQAISVDGAEFMLFQLPYSADRKTYYPNAAAVDNVEAFKRLTAQGLSGLEDGDELRIVPRHAGDSFGTDANKVYSLTRKGNYFTFQKTDISAEQISKPSHKQNDASEFNDNEGVIDTLFQRQTDIEAASRGLGWASRQDKLGDTVRKMGFTSDALDAPIPLPDTIKRAIVQLQTEGVHIPNIRFFARGHIATDAYDEAWGDGDFPASEQPAYFAHDILQEHFRPLVLFRERAMGIGTLYARAVAEQDEIIAYKPATDHETNKQHPVLRKIVLKGREKIDHAADCLDRYTGEHGDIAGAIDLPEGDQAFELAVSGQPPNTWRRMPQMVETILNSSHRKELLDYLESVDSKAVDPQTGEFSYETYAREMVSEAREFWGITPQEPKPAAQEFMADEGLY